MLHRFIFIFYELKILSRSSLQEPSLLPLVPNNFVMDAFLILHNPYSQIYLNNYGIVSWRFTNPESSSFGLLIANYFPIPGKT